MLGKVGKDSGIQVQVVRLCKEHIDLEAPGSIEQLIDQVAATPGCVLHTACSSAKPGAWSAWTPLLNAPTILNSWNWKENSPVNSSSSCYPWGRRGLFRVALPCRGLDSA